MALSKPVSRPLRTLLPKAAASCASAGAAYGRCIGARYTEVEKGMCAEEFAAFKKCVGEAMKRK